MQLFMFAASLQADSLNKKFINLVAKLLREAEHSVDLADFSEFEMPLYNADIQNHQGFPETVTQFVERMHKADALIISTPEYNFSIPGTLKNLIDWVSRVTPMPWANQCILLLSASPSLVGGNRSLWATRVPLEVCGSFVYPDMFSLASANEAFDQEGHLKSDILQKRLMSLLNNFMGMVGKMGDKKR